MSDRNAIQQELQNILDYLMRAGLAYFINPVVQNNEFISWGSYTGRQSFLSHRGDASVDQYHQWVLDAQYSALLIDGSLLQIRYDFGVSEVSGHRLAYIPCPFDIDPQFLTEMTPGDAIELYKIEKAQEIRLRSPVRFDFAPDQAKPGHPASHLTINSANCRIACSSPLRVGRFIDFVYRHFYPNLHQAHQEYFSELARGVLGSSCLTEEDSEGLHIRW